MNIKDRRDKMALKRSKVAIVGIGNVGIALAHQIVINDICDDLVLIDLRKGKNWAEVMDLQHSRGFSETKMYIINGEYSDCADSDIVIITVAAPYKIGMTRLDMLDKATVIVKSIVDEIMSTEFNGIFIVVTNPVDAMTYLVQQVSGLAPNRVIGTGTALDTARLRCYLADTMGVDPRSVDAMCLGEHGDSMVIPWSQITVGGKKFNEILVDNRARLAGVETSKVREEIAQIAYNIVEEKGATNFGRASVVAKITKAIIRDEHVVIPISTMLNGEYGIKDVYMGVPAVITGNGVKELVEYNLEQEELDRLYKSVEILKMANQKCLQVAKLSTN
ncbi:MAG: L-lactate dehydrogenase, partial [Bacteroidales bacterium]